MSSLSYKSLSLLLFSTLTIITSAIGQQGTIRGTVYEKETGFSMIGANVIIQGALTGGSTDLDGKFSFNADPGTYNIQVSFITAQTVVISGVKVTAGEVTVLDNIVMEESSLLLQELVITAEATRKSEAALMAMKQNSVAMLDGITASKMELTGDGNAVEAAKRVTGVTVEGGKYVYVRGLGDRYSKTTLNGMDIPGLDPDKNSLQLDIIPSALIDNLVVSKNFTAELPADFTGGLLNVETKAFPESKIASVSFSMSYNPDMHLNKNYLTYEGGKLDFMGFDNGARALPAGASNKTIPTPINSASEPEKVNQFVKSFNPTLGSKRQTSLLDYSIGASFGNQVDLFTKDESRSYNPKLGYIASVTYKSGYSYFDDVRYGEYQRFADPDENELRYATVQNGELGKRNILIGAMGGLAYKTKMSKFKLMVMRLQSGESTAGKFNIDNDGAAVGQSGYLASSDNLEYNQRSLTNFFLGGDHVLSESKWEIDWRFAPTISRSDDPDIRKTAFTFQNDVPTFSPGAGGNPSRIWRDLSEFTLPIKVDMTKDYRVRDRKSKLKFGAGHTYKQRDYSILFFDLQGVNPVFAEADPALVLIDENIHPNKPFRFYYQSANPTPNPNSYESNAQTTAAYVSNQINPFARLDVILGLRVEKYLQRHTGRDQAWASGNTATGKNLVNEVVLDAIDLFPSANLIYALNEKQNLRVAYSKTIARPSFKELSFAQILDPLTNRIFNGTLFTYPEWDGKLIETRIDNLDLRWEMFMENAQTVSFSAFFKQFDNPIELVRIPAQQTGTEFQPRNVGDGRLYGFEFEFRKDLGFISEPLSKLNLNGNFTYVESFIDMTDVEYNARKLYERTGQTVSNERQMAGQAPYVINAGIGYSDSDKGLDIGLYYNVKGPTLYIVGIGLYSDVYAEPFHNLDFGVNKKLGEEGKTVVDFKVNNILADRVESFFQSYRAQEQVFSSYNPGRTFSIGIRQNL